MDFIFVRHPADRKWAREGLDSDYSVASEAGSCAVFEAAAVDVPATDELEQIAAFAGMTVPAHVLVIGPRLVHTAAGEGPRRVAGAYPPSMGALLVGIEGSRSGHFPHALLNSMAHEAWHALVHSGLPDPFADGGHVADHRRKVRDAAMAIRSGVAPDADGGAGGFSWLLSDEEVDARAFAGWASGWQCPFGSIPDPEVMRIWQSLTDGWIPPGKGSTF